MSKFTNVKGTVTKQICSEKEMCQPITEASVKSMTGRYLDRQVAQETDRQTNDREE